MSDESGSIFAVQNATIARTWSAWRSPSNWRTRTVPGLAFYHHRPLGHRDGSHTARWRAQGRAYWFMGYRSAYLFLRTLRRAPQNPAALAMIPSYLGAALRREPCYRDAEVRRYLRERQGIRAALLRARSTEARA